MKLKNLLTLSFLIIFSVVSWGQTNYYVSSEALTLRDDTTKNYEAVTILSKYDNLKVVEIKNGLAQVTFGSQKGYVSADYIKTGRAIVESYEVRTGAWCADGTSSSATGRGACSHHGGVSSWKTRTHTSVKIEQ